MKKFASSVKLDASTRFLFGPGTCLAEFFKQGQYQPPIHDNPNTPNAPIFFL